MSDLASRRCEPCSAGTPPLTPAQIDALRAELHADWEVVDDHHLTRGFRFADFARALAFVNRVGELAEEQGHHPDVHLAWGRARIDIWTHAIDGLSEADFVFAAKCDRLYPPR